MGKETIKHGMSRRGFMGAAAGAAAGATVAGTLVSKAVGESDPSAHDQVGVPDHCLGIQMYTYRNLIPSGASEATRQNYFPVLYQHGTRRLELASGNNFGLPNRTAVRNYLTADVKPWHNNPNPAPNPYEWGFDVYSDHNGPTTSSGKGETQVNSRIDQINEYGLKHLGVGGGWNQGTNTPANWLTATNNANLWGQLFQQGTPSRDGVPGVKWYGHNHGAEVGVFGAGNGEWTGRRYLEVYFENVDTNYAFAQLDLAWTRQPFPNGAAGNQAFLDWVLEFSNQPGKVLMYHIKGMTGNNGSEVDVNQPTDVITTSGGWKTLFENLKDPSAFTYHWERDGNSPNNFDASNHLTSQERFRSLLQDTPLDRSGIGAPANVTPPAIWGISKVGTKLRCEGDDRGEWVRFPKALYSFQWTRNGKEIPGATGKQYITSAADTGKRISVSVSARNSEGATQEAAAHITMDAPSSGATGPEVIEPPTVSGSGRHGSMVNYVAGVWGGGGQDSFQWYRDATPIPNGMGEGETGTTNVKRCRVNPAWSGQQIRCEVTRTGKNGSTTVMSSNSVTVQ